MGHYKANLRDIEFNLFEMFGGTSTFGSADFPDVDVETARDVLAQTERLAVTELAESFIESDRTPPIFDAGGAGSEATGFCSGGSNLRLNAGRREFETGCRDCSRLGRSA